MSLPGPWWAAVHGGAAFAALSIAGHLLLPQLALAPLPAALLGRATSLVGPLLFAFLLLGVLVGLHGRPHRATWVGLSGLAVVTVALGIFSHLLLWGQVRSWAATGPGLHLTALLPLLLPLALLAVLLLLRHFGPFWQLRRPTALTLVPFALAPPATSASHVRQPRPPGPRPRARANRPPIRWPSPRISRPNPGCCRSTPCSAPCRERRPG